MIYTNVLFVMSLNKLYELSCETQLPKIIDICNTHISNNYFEMFKLNNIYILNQIIFLLNILSNLTMCICLFYILYKLGHIILLKIKKLFIVGWLLSKIFLKIVIAIILIGILHQTCIL